MNSLSQSFEIFNLFQRKLAIRRRFQSLVSIKSKIIMSYWRLYYHLVWATKQRLPLIKPELEAKLHGYIIGKADYLGCITHDINGTENHIHIVASIPPSLSISQYVKKIKGSSSHHWNNTLASNSDKFYWQQGYGVFSMGSKQLETAVNYVKNQKIHHSQGTTIPALENDAPDTS
ncbi:transposase [Hyella patelloides LEGE 07179]|uniref:Transposase n=2 Tax=Hyella TaxID=945733 RepID=A0A563VNV0_9CYAN|nr:transposase [Hyella patelloides LEGE 07179]